MMMEKIQMLTTDDDGDGVEDDDGDVIDTSRFY